MSDEPSAGGSPPSTDGVAADYGPRAAAAQHAGAPHQAMPPAADPTSHALPPAAPHGGSAKEVSPGNLSQGDVEKLTGQKVAEELAW